MPLQPSRKDNAGPPGDTTDLSAITRHQGSYLQGLDPGFLSGRLATPQQPRQGPSELVGGDEGGGDAEDDAVVGEDGDRYILTSLSTLTWPLSYIPISETLVVRWHPDAGAGVEWKRGEHYTIDDDDLVVTVRAEALAAAKAHVGDVLSAQYLRLEGDQDAPSDMLSLVLRGTSLMYDEPATIALPAGTQIGDFIVALCATSVVVLPAGPGGGTITDPRLTKVAYGTWVGIATDLSDVTYDNPGGLRMAGTVATFVGPDVAFENAATSGPGAGGIASLPVPAISAPGAVLGLIQENRNGFSASLDGFPTGWIQVTANSGGTICKAFILYWPPDGTSSPPTGNVDYHSHIEGEVYLDIVGLQGESGE